MYIPKDHYLWDFWLLRKQENYHLFYLQAPRGLSDPEMRHGLATVGYAVSRDLRNWEYVGTILKPGPRGTWDDRAIWTGSVIARGDAFYMLYTGTNRAEEGRIQRIGLATSSDLLCWKKHPANPLIEAAPRWYEDEKASPFSERAWRDPYVIHYEHENVFYAFITARTKQGPVVDRGCIALARSSDLVDWEVFPPVQLPQTFMQLEVPQCVIHQGMCYLLFSVSRAWYTSGPATQASIPPATGTYYAVSRSLFGPYGRARVLLGDEIGSHYGAKLIQAPDGGWVILSWLGQVKTGVFIGGLSDPKAVRLLPNGTIEVA